MFRKNLTGLHVLKNTGQFIVHSEQGNLKRNVDIQHR